MRKSRINLPNRCYHLIRRVAHRSFVLGDDEKTRLVDLIRRVAAMRLNRNCGNLLWHSSQTLRCPNQFEGCSRGADGKLKFSSQIERRIQDILDRANQGAPGKYYKFVELAKSVAASDHKTPFEEEVYAFRTDGSADPGGSFVRIKNVDGPGKNVLLNQKFYTLE